MKKYVKPDLKYENFEISENIAACSGGSTWIVRGAKTLDECYLAYSGDNSMLEGANPYSSGNCTTKDSEANCYFALSSNGAAAFSSY